MSSVSYPIRERCWATVCKTVRPMLSVRCPVCLSVCLSCLSVTLVYCGQTVGRIRMKLGMQVGLGPGHIVLGGDPSATLPKRHIPPPIFGPYLLRLRPNGCSAWIKMSLGMELGLSPGDFALGGDPAPPPKRGSEPPIFGPCLLRPTGWMDEAGTLQDIGLSPGDFVLDGDSVPFPSKGAEPPLQFSAHFYCGQTARCIKMPLGMDVGLSPGDFVLDGDPVFPPQQRGRSPLPIFGHFYCAQTAGCIKMPLGM